MTMTISPKVKDILDITYHSAPTIVFGGIAGFMVAFALRQPWPIEPIYIAMIIAGIVCTLLFSYMWTKREETQHGGHLGGIQSKLEAYVPLAMGPISLVISTSYFYFNPL